MLGYFSKGKSVVSFELLGNLASVDGPSWPVSQCLPIEAFALIRAAHVNGDISDENYDTIFTNLNVHYTSKLTTNIQNGSGYETLAQLW